MAYSFVIKLVTIVAKVAIIKTSSYFTAGVSLQRAESKGSSRQSGD